MSEIIEQGSEAWRALRLGKVTASRIADVCARTKSGWGASRANYMAQLIAETLTGVPQDSYTNAAMQWGLDHEDGAKAAYEFRTDAAIIPVGFILHPVIELAGASPDGLIGEDGLIEAKCPQTATHLDTLLDPGVAGKYFAQMQWQMACSGRQWCDFVSFDPRMPEHLRLYVKRIMRDDQTIEQLEKDVIVFLGEMERKLESLAKLYPTPEAAAA